MSERSAKEERKKKKVWENLLTALCRVKVASGRLVYHYRSKVASGPKCGDCGKGLPGIAHLRPKEYRGISRRQKTVNRAYGGNKCATCVRDRVVRAFLIEERKIVKNVLKGKQGPKKAEE